MLRFLAKPWELLKALFYLAFPMARGARGAADMMGSPSVWVGRAILVATVLAGLTWLNHSEWIGLYRHLPSWMSYYWLPALALTLYTTLWLGWWVYRVLQIEVPVEATEYPDIDRAWQQATDALERQSIRLDSTPLFLVLGGSSSGEEALFQAAAMKAQVKQVPRDDAEPLHVTANRDGIWLTCPGTSVLGQQLLDPSGGFGASGEVSLDTLAGESPDAFKTMGAPGGETLRIEDFVGSLKEAQARMAAASPRYRKSVDTERFTSRLRYLCRLIARDRGGLCPINGILVVLPVTTADPGSPTADICAAAKADLKETFEVLRMRCPVLFLISDLDRLDGFADLIERLPSNQRSNRMGQRFPLVPDLDPETVPGRIKDSIGWIGASLFPTMVNSLFQVESPGGEDVNDAVRANGQLFRFLVSIKNRRDRLAQLVRDCIPELAEEPVLYRGCYLAGTGQDPATEQAFAPGVLSLLIKQQDSVTWTDAALRQDARFSGLARGFKAFLILAISVLALLIAWKFVSEISSSRGRESQPPESRGRQETP